MGTEIKDAVDHKSAMPAPGGLQCPLDQQIPVKWASIAIEGTKMERVGVFNLKLCTRAKSHRGAFGHTPINGSEGNYFEPEKDEVYGNVEAGMGTIVAKKAIVQCGRLRTHRETCAEASGVERASKII